MDLLGTNEGKMDQKQYKLNLPKELDDWIEQRASESLRSKSAEIIYILKEKMEMEKAEART